MRKIKLTGNSQKSKDKVSQTLIKSHLSSRSRINFRNWEENRVALCACNGD